MQFLVTIWTEKYFWDFGLVVLDTALLTGYGQISVTWAPCEWEDGGPEEPSELFRETWNVSLGDETWTQISKKKKKVFIEAKCTKHNIKHFQANNPVAFGTVTMLCNHRLQPHFCHPERKLSLWICVFWVFHIQYITFQGQHHVSAVHSHHGVRQFFIPFWDWKKISLYIYHTVYPFICWWTYELSPPFHYRK